MRPTQGKQYEGGALLRLPGGLEQRDDGGYSPASMSAKTPSPPSIR